MLVPVTRLHVLDANSSASVALGTRATSTPRLHVLGVHSSASVAIGTRPTSTPCRTCDTSEMFHTRNFLSRPELTLAHVRHLESDCYDSWKQGSQIPSTHVCAFVSHPGRATG